VRTAIWNGLDASVTPPRVTKYDNEAIFTGSAVVLDGAGPGGKGPGIINIYPGLCNKNDWPGCGTGTILAQAVPADYANDELLINWTKPSYNPIMENTQRDPSTPWKTPSGEWRLRTYDSSVYGAASDADLIQGKWYEIGKNKDFRQCECPSFYPLPKATPGFEAEYDSALKAGSLPTHVHKTSCGGDWWQLGTYYPGAPKQPDHFNVTAGWEDVFVQKKIDQGKFYASKDGEYPTKDGATRRINWGWAQVPPASTQTLPREITFNAAARTLEQAPIEELQALRGTAAFSKTDVHIYASPIGLSIAKDVVKQSEVIATFELPTKAAYFGIIIGNTSCRVDYTPPQSDASKYDVPVNCDGVKDTLSLTPGEKTVEIRAFSDWTFLEVYFQKGRVAMTVVSALTSDASVAVTSTVTITAPSVAVYPMKAIWTTADAVRKAPRVYGTGSSSSEIVV